MRVNPGDFITLDYKKFDGTIDKGIYFIIYHEGLDIKGATTFLAAKVSTKHAGYAVPVQKKCMKFLKHNSYINVSSLHRFQESEVSDILGRANNFIYNNVCGQLNSLLKAADKQLQSMVK